MWGMGGAERAAHLAMAEAQRVTIQCLRQEISWQREWINDLKSERDQPSPDPYPAAADPSTPPRFPTEVQAAIDAKAGDHAGIRAELEAWAERELARPESDPEEVVASILVGADLSDY